jgi:hypothetical protein
MPTDARSNSSGKSYSPIRLIGSHETTEWLATGDRPDRCSDLVDGGLDKARLRDTVRYPSFAGAVIDHLRVGRTAFYRYFPGIVSGNCAISPERRS